MKRLTPDHARKMREGLQRSRAARAPTLQQRLAQAHLTETRKVAVGWVQAAMQDGLEWAVKNPDTFLKGGGQTIGRILTDGERKVVTEVLQDLLERLQTNKRKLWRCPGGREKGSRNVTTIERELTQHGARRGW